MGWRPGFLRWLRSRFRNEKSEAPVHLSTLDNFVYSAPCAQNAIDLIPGWNHRLPPHVDVVAGDVHMHEDPRIHWAVKQYGPIDEARILELGPLEGSHTWLLERLGARQIDAIEGNKTAFLRCLISKEILGSQRTRFHLGDFVRALEAPQRYDLIVACGVLYHMTDPLLLLERMAARTDAIYLWTHYFDDAEMPVDDHRRGAFRSPRRPYKEVTTAGKLGGVEMKLHLRSYYRAWRDSKYCGGPVDRHYWLEKTQLIAALRGLGFNHLAFADETPDHPNGPAISIFARRD